MIDLSSYILKVPDFPKKGVLFRDVTPLFADSKAMDHAFKNLVNPQVLPEIDYFVGIESRGFIIASYLAAVFQKGFIPIRKAGKLPPPVKRESYFLEYGEATIEMKEGSGSIMLVDDVLATGGTLRASIELCHESGFEIKDVAVLVNLSYLNNLRFNERRIRSLLQYDQQ